MRKQLSFLIILSFLLGACSSGDSVEAISSDDDASGDNITISGVIDGAPNTIYYLEQKLERGMTSIAQVTSDASGKFEMTGHIDHVGMFHLRKGDDPTQTLLLTLVPGDRLELNAKAGNFSTEPKASGTAWSKTMMQYIEEVNLFRQEQQKLQQLQGTVPNEELQEKYFELKGRIDDFALNAMTKEPSNPFNIVLTTYAIPPMDFQNWNPDFLEALKGVTQAFEKEYPDAPVTAAFSAQTWEIQKKYDDYVANNSGTRPAPEIALKNPDGKEIRLSSLRGKYVLIDFWASWCGPCRRESPNVVKMYNKYKDKGFTVYSVSLDDNAEKWKEAIKKDGLVWPNHVSDLLQWKSPMPQLYGFDGIPYTVLVNKEGMIIGTGLRGSALEQKLKDIFEN